MTEKTYGEFVAEQRMILEGTVKVPPSLLQEARDAAISIVLSLAAPSVMKNKDTLPDHYAAFIKAVSRYKLSSRDVNDILKAVVVPKKKERMMSVMVDYEKHFPKNYMRGLANEIEIPKQIELVIDLYGKQMPPNQLGAYIPDLHAIAINLSRFYLKDFADERVNPKLLELALLEVSGTIEHELTHSIEHIFISGKEPKRI
ncbi:MAG: hypothetical protein BV459_04000, partial [Thermoplasmata archaeon M11B2D]